MRSVRWLLRLLDFSLDFISDLLPSITVSPFSAPVLHRSFLSFLSPFVASKLIAEVGTTIKIEGLTCLFQTNVHRFAFPKFIRTFANHLQRRKQRTNFKRDEFWAFRIIAPFSLLLSFSPSSLRNDPILKIYLPAVVSMSVGNNRKGKGRDLLNQKRISSPR